MTEGIKVIKIINGLMQIKKTSRYWHIPQCGFVNKEQFDKLMFLQMSTSLSVILEEQLKASGGNMVYQFNAQTSSRENVYKPQDYVRLSVCVNSATEENLITPISRYDNYIKGPILSLICNIHNFPVSLYDYFNHR